MTESVEQTTVETTPTVEPRFSVRKIVKATAITTAVVAGAVMLKRKLSASVDGEVTATVSTNDES